MQRRRHQHRRPLLLLPLTILAMAASLASAFQRCFARAAAPATKGSGGRTRLFAAAATTTTGHGAMVTDARAACECVGFGLFMVGVSSFVGVRESTCASCGGVQGF